MAQLLCLEGVARIYESDGALPVEAVRDVSLSVERGEMVALMGPSGCGKSTLLHLMGAVDRPTRGRIWLEGNPLHELREEELVKIRRHRIGFVFQFFYLLPTLTVQENVELPLVLAGLPAPVGLVREFLTWVGLWEKRSALPAHLSGGEMQRAALARAVIHRPALVLADEPTGNLDSRNGREVLRLLRSLCREENTSVVMATHSREAADCADRILHMKDGRLL